MGKESRFGESGRKHRGLGTSSPVSPANPTLLQLLDPIGKVFNYRDQTQMDPFGGLGQIYRFHLLLLLLLGGVLLLSTALNLQKSPFALKNQ